jgi:hypothetical protein
MPESHSARRAWLSLQTSWVPRASPYCAGISYFTTKLPSSGTCEIVPSPAEPSYLDTGSKGQMTREIREAAPKAACPRCILCVYAFLWLAPIRTILIYKMIVARAVTRTPVFLEIWRFISCSLNLSRATWTQSPTMHHTLFLKDTFQCHSIYA